MADYKTIFGQKIQSISSDPSVAITGQVWYNSTTASVKANIFYNGVWATGSAAMNNGRKSVGSAGASSTAGVVAGGITLMPSGQQTNQNDTETYDGTTWTQGNNIGSTRRGLGSAGVSSTAALIFGGYLDPYTTASESWDGTNWTGTPSLNSARDNIGGAGTSTSALAIAGQQGVSVTGQVESWNGSSWTVGTCTSAILNYGGSPGTATEIWDGTSWTAGNALPVTQSSAGSNGSGPSSTAAWYAGGSAPSITSPADEGWTGMQNYQYGAEKITLAST